MCAPHTRSICHDPNYLECMPKNWNIKNQALDCLPGRLFASGPIFLVPLQSKVPVSLLHSSARSLVLLKQPFSCTLLIQTMHMSLITTCSYFRSISIEITSTTSLPPMFKINPLTGKTKTEVTDNLFIISLLKIYIYWISKFNFKEIKFYKLKNIFGSINDLFCCKSKDKSVISFNIKIISPVNSVSFWHNYN